MRRFWDFVLSKWRVDVRLLFIYLLVYFVWGMGMNSVGMAFEIARFVHGWQVFTCYILYMVPISLLLRGWPFHRQYAYGLLAMGVLELSGYALGTSYAYPGNVLDRYLGIRNFSLAMTLFFGLYFPLGNLMVGALYRFFFSKTTE